MKIWVAAILSIMVPVMTGCSKTASPHFIDGHYYMGGDSNCIRYEKIGPTQIMCATKDHKLTGYRNAMTDQELAMYQHQQVQQQIAHQQAMADIDAGNQQLAANTARIYQPMAIPSVAPVGLPGPTVVHCTTASIYTNCRY
ncbi:hypothetical protein [Mesorhizobium marinum]|uniref:hypothetical protein n=1 Tax=Mesorhizobium marinum TaxID=3228790 RepID=UPI0034665B5B